MLEQPPTHTAGGKESGFRPRERNETTSTAVFSADAVLTQAEGELLRPEIQLLKKMEFLELNISDESRIFSGKNRKWMAWKKPY